MYTVVSADDIKIDIPETETSDNLEVEDLMKMINSLSHGYKTIFNLYVIEGFSHKEIADMLNISEGTSKSQLARARYLLMEMVNKSAIVKRNATASE